MIRVRLFIFCFLIAGGAASAEDAFEFWPGAQYDPSVPTFLEVLGHQPGQEIVSHVEILLYLRALEAADPHRMQIHEYARSWEGRELVYAVISSAANMARIEEIRQGIQRVADPREGSEAQRRLLVESLPATVWLGYSVHGDEVSGADAALLTAYHLLASTEDSMVQQILSGSVILIDPLQNPDGRERFIQNFRTSRGLEADSHPLAAEQNTPWPGGRTNHYFFDLNRDWLAVTQPETRGKIRALQEWYPLVFVDLHEMGSNSTYFFAPEADPFNPHLAEGQKASLEIFGRNNAKWFDRFGFDYFTREVYDAFYPGYGASWPSYYGSVAMTYEQASSGGLLYRRSDGKELHFRDAVRHHFVASLSTAEAAATNARQLWNDFDEYRRTAIEEGSTEDIRTYIVPDRGDSSAITKMIGLLIDQGVEIQRATREFDACGEEYPAGTYVISLAQPAKRLIRTLLDANVQMEEDFLKEQERRRRKRLPDEIYDVTAWSLPLMFNVPCIPCSKAVRGDFEPADGRMIRPGALDGENASVAYLVPWGTAAAGRFLAASLREGLRVLSTDKSFRQADRQYPAGTLIFKVTENPDDLESILAGLAEASGAEVVATNTSWVEDGINFGSRHVVHVRRPKIALAWDSPTSSGGAGATRFVLERQFGYPVTPIRTRRLGSADLSQFQVIILPNARSGGAYASVLRSSGAQRLRDWVAAGGTLIAIGNAVSFLAESDADFLSISRENLIRDDEEENGATATKSKKSSSSSENEDDDARVPGTLLDSKEAFEEAIRAEETLPDSVAGVLLQAHVDQEHWLGAGVPETVNVLVEGRNIFTPIKLEDGVNVAYYGDKDELLVSGYLWEENRKQLAFKPFVIVQPQGRGVVIAFTADPNFRAYMDGLNILFLNAVFRGPAHARPLVPNREF